MNFFQESTPDFNLDSNTKVKEEDEKCSEKKEINDIKTTEEEESKNKENQNNLNQTSSLYEAGLKEFTKLGYLDQCKFAGLYRTFCDEFLDFLKPIAETNQIITKEVFIF